MKRILLLLIVLTIMSCKENVKKTIDISDEKEQVEKFKTGSPTANILGVFEAHGRLDTWKSKKSLSYTMPKSSGNETQTVDLMSRMEKIETPNFAMGYDGRDYWLADEKKAYKGDPIFYHNLIFYFYAMPFVLADSGINYGETENLEFEEKSYPGIRISYDEGVGISSKDEYFIHYDADTNQMAWLGYTVTYRSGEKSDNIKWIRYNDWQEVSGLILPKSLTWHKVEDGKIKEVASTRTFENVILSEEAKPLDFYAIPENGVVVTKQ